MVNGFEITGIISDSRREVIVCDRQTGGSGLGLAIARAIASTHQGTIQVKSQVGRGSRFTVRLPMG